MPSMCMGRGLHKGLPPPKHSLHKSAVHWRLVRKAVRQMTKSASSTLRTTVVQLRAGMTGSWMQPGAVPLSGQNTLCPSGQVQYCIHTSNISGLFGSGALSKHMRVTNCGLTSVCQCPLGDKGTGQTHTYSCAYMHEGDQCALAANIGVQDDPL